ncbi:LicD family protein [Oscillospiraceae bacterium HV4-5-C5C]|nr:LicD family protein [Oscillospiraceae bacterium HV4-5-C5C]
MKKQHNSGFSLTAADPRIHDIHAIQLAMLKIIDQVCQAENIPYFLLFGTLLGAVRHQGFIPWDDDIDLGVWRKDYDRLLSALQTKIQKEAFEVQSAEFEPLLAVPYAKLRARHTRFVEQGHEKLTFNQGIFVDIFPLDNVPDSKLGQKLQQVDFFLHYFPIRVKNEGYRSERKWLQRLYDSRAQKNPAVLWQTCRRSMQRWGKPDSQLCIAYPSARVDYDSSYLLRQAMQDTVRLPFCGSLFAVPAGWDEQLKQLFGDYQQLPPPDQRHGHHLSEFYIDYDFWAPVLEAYLPAVMPPAEPPDAQTASGTAANRTAVTATNPAAQEAGTS